MEKTWYRKGLSFACTGCGKCCGGSPGYVWVNEEEIEEMAAFLEITPFEFKKKYTRRVGKRLSLTESKTTYDCVFLKNKQCQIYKVKPTQCRTYPWWPQNLSSEAAWKETAAACEGISETAPTVPFEEIEQQLLIQIKRNA